jgi:hypothetical protein
MSKVKVDASDRERSNMNLIKKLDNLKVLLQIVLEQQPI